MLIETLVAVVAAPMLVAVSTLAARRWGPRAGGLLSAFPAIVGPVLLIAALAHGPAFASRAANGTLLGLVALGAFAAGYGRTARQGSWPASLGAGWASAALAALLAGLCAGNAGSPLGLLVATGSLIAAGRVLPPRAAGAQAAYGPTRSSPTLPLRVAVTALLVVSLSAAAGAVGPLVGGMLAALPVLASVLTVFTHREAGGAAATELLRGTLAGMAGFVAFCQLLAMMIGPIGIAAGFAAATAAAVVVQALAAYFPLARPAAQSAANAAAVPSP